MRLGKGKAAENLELILIEASDRKLSNRVGSIYNDYCIGFTHIEQIESKQYKQRVATLWLKEFQNTVKLQKRFPEDVRDHLLNVLSVRYREVLRGE